MKEKNIYNAPECEWQTIPDSGVICASGVSAGTEEFDEITDINW